MAAQLSVHCQTQDVAIDRIGSQALRRTLLKQMSIMIRKIQKKKKISHRSTNLHMVWDVEAGE